MLPVVKLILRLSAAFLVGTLTGCSASIYETAKAGRFEGTILVMWVEGNASGSGDGRFVYVPDPMDGRKSLAFHRATKVDGETVHVDVIRPEWMYTDGGSIPRLVQPVKGLNPWGYAPAYMVHDWLFVARKCLTDGMASPAEQSVSGVTFRESYQIMAEMLRTLEQSDQISGSDVQPAAISWAVSTGISRELWEQKGQCEANRISDKHKQMIRDRLGFGPAALRSIDPDTAGVARIVQVIEF